MPLAAFDPASFSLGYLAGALTVTVIVALTLWATIERVLIPSIMRALRAHLVRPDGR